MRISALMKLKRYDAVLTSANAYVASGRPSAEIFELRGVARQARGDHAAAIADFNRALELQSNAAPAVRSRLLNQRGWAYQYADATRLALADFEESLRLEPNQGDALCGRGLARVRLGQWRPAVEDAEAGVRHARAASASSLIEDASPTRPRPSSTAPGSTPRPSSSRHRTSADRASAPWPSIADIAPEPWTCSTRPSCESPTASAARRSSMTPRCDRSESHPVEARACE